MLHYCAGCALLEACEMALIKVCSDKTLAASLETKHHNIAVLLPASWKLGCVIIIISTSNTISS